MALDFLAPFGDDLNIGNALQDLGVVGQQGSDDFDVASARSELIQRLIRRLLTPKGEWIPFPAYGGGLREKVHEVLTPQLVGDIKATIIDQLLQEPDVVGVPAPEVSIAQIPNGIFVNITVYSDAGAVDFTLNTTIL